MEEFRDDQRLGSAVAVSAFLLPALDIIFGKARINAAHDVFAVTAALFRCRPLMGLVRAQEQARWRR